MMYLRKITAFLCGLLAAIFFAAAVLAALADGAGGSAPLMQNQLERWAPSADTGLPAQEYSGMSRMITQYLSGQRNSFQYSLTDEDGTEVLLFHDYEQTHMADCLALFRLARSILLISSICFLILLLGMYLTHRRREWLIGWINGIAGILLVCAVLVIWGCVDFVSLFLTFHHLVFDNMLWILDPRTDLLIRLMPTDFFVSYAAIIAGSWFLILVLGLGIAVSLFRHDHNKRRVML